jgi:4,5-DOPA dioxygenase extradiol
MDKGRSIWGEKEVLQCSRELLSVCGCDHMFTRFYTCQRVPRFDEIGKRLAPLRDEGILIVGSGNLVHNLHTYAWGRHAVEPYDWAVSFESRVRELLLADEHNPLIDYENKLGSEATLAVPTPDHYLPLLYVTGTRTPSEPVTFPVEGVDGGSISMLAVRVG